MGRSWAVLAAMMALASCSRADHPVTAVDPDVSMINKARAAAGHDIKDPDSAEFRELRVVTVSNPQGSLVMSVCGEMNQKNEIGCYMGYQPFLYVAERSYGTKEIEGRTHEYPVGDVELVRPDEPQHRKYVAALCTPTRSYPEEELAHPYADLSPEIRRSVLGSSAGT